MLDGSFTWDVACLTAGLELLFGKTLTSIRLLYPGNKGSQVFGNSETWGGINIRCQVGKGDKYELAGLGWTNGRGNDNALGLGALAFTFVPISKQAHAEE